METIRIAILSAISQLFDRILGLAHARPRVENRRYEGYVEEYPDPYDIEALEREYREVEARVQIYEAYLREYEYSQPCVAYRNWKE